MNQKISPPSQKLDGLFLLALSMAVFFVGVTEFMLSSMLGRWRRRSTPLPAAPPG